MKIGVAQLNSNDVIRHNLNQIIYLVENSKSEGPRAIIFPENSLYMRIDQNLSVESLELSDPIFTELSNLCNQTKIAIHLTTPIRESDKIFNASVWVDAGVSPRIIYRKIHLFDIELTGQKPMRESEVFSYGAEPNVFTINDFKIGSSICYDIRFAELYANYARSEVDVIVVPAAFLVKTGQAHWETLLRARAIESQCYVLAAAQAGVHKSAQTGALRETYGHSMIINPWGEITECKQDGAGVIFAELSHDAIKNVRKQIPMRAHRRIDF